ncbi:MAG: tyrosine--tRNA ligase [candidate division Zixibacteria bacterium]|nr:tyrosine--tRNA ligase [candidate division Zixibacteria bacterium]
MLNLEEQLKVIKRGTVEILPEEELILKLKRSIRETKPLRVKQGFDPTAPDIHLGHTVCLRKLRQFQELGHQVILIIGDFTGMVGDPSGRSETRPQLTLDEIKRNAQTYQEQFFRVVDESKTEVHHNGEWFSQMSFLKIMHLASNFTVARMLERDDFSKRYKEQIPISIHELFYPLMQAYDSVMIKADVEIGATEQKFNLLAGRQIQEVYGQRPQVILTMPVLVGTDGEQRMSKSLGNYIGVAEPPAEIFGKIMSIPDEQIYSYFELVTDVGEDELIQIKKELDEKKTNPMILKKRLGREIVRMYYNQKEADKASQEFKRVFSKKELPEEIPVKHLEHEKVEMWIGHFLVKAGCANSTSEIKRLIKQGGLYIDNKRIDDENLKVSVAGEKLVRLGRRRFFRIVGRVKRQ